MKKSGGKMMKLLNCRVYGENARRLVGGSILSFGTRNLGLVDISPPQSRIKFVTSRSDVEVKIR
jgi:hypothetical protein